MPHHIIMISRRHLPKMLIELGHLDDCVAIKACICHWGGHMLVLIWSKAWGMLSRWSCWAVLFPIPLHLKKKNEINRKCSGIKRVVQSCSMKPNDAFMTFCSGAQKCCSLESWAGEGGGRKRYRKRCSIMIHNQRERACHHFIMHDKHD